MGIVKSFSRKISDFTKFILFIFVSSAGLGTTEAGIVEPISGGEVRDRESQYRGIGHSTSADPFEAFRKSKAGSFYTRMKERDRGRDEARKSKRSERGGDT